MSVRTTLFFFFSKEGFDFFLDLVASKSVQSGSKDGNDGNKVIGEFFGWRSVSTMENHDFPMGALGQDGFEQVKTETAESVFMCDDNLSDISLERVVQKGLKSFSFEVNA